MKKVFLFLSVILLSLTACTSDVDVRDDLVGSWSYVTTGSMSMTMGGVEAGDIPLDATGTATITKVGEDQIMIDELTATVDGDKLTFEPETQNETEDGMTMAVTVTRTGTISGKTITINETYTGTWSAAGLMSGAVSGTAKHVFTKK